MENFRAPKIKLFGWKVLHGGLPVKENLRARGMDVNVRCPVCGDFEENVLHMLFRCPEAAIIWRLSPLRLEFKPGITSCIKGWLEFLLQQYKEVRWWSVFWATAWGIWLRRNSWVFQTKRTCVQHSVLKATTLVAEYEEANRKMARTCVSDVGGRVRQPPEQPWYKLNTDAAMSEGDWLGLGAVVRDYIGDVMLATCWKVRGDRNVEVAEAIAARHGVLTAIEAGLTSLVLETDSFKLFQHLTKKKKEASYFGKLVQDILMLCNRCSRIMFKHVRREGNRVAHEMAKISLSFSDMRVWIEEVPPSIHEFVVADVLSSAT